MEVETDATLKVRTFHPEHSWHFGYIVLVDMRILLYGRERHTVASKWHFQRVNYLIEQLCQWQGCWDSVRKSGKQWGTIPVQLGMRSYSLIGCRSGATQAYNKNSGPVNTGPLLKCFEKFARGKAILVPVSHCDVQFSCFTENNQRLVQQWNLPRIYYAKVWSKELYEVVR